jgi:hypothetical protein
MHPRTTELLGYLDAADADLRAAYHAVPAERRAARPAPERWSPAEVVHHLAIVERRVTQRIASLVEQARALPPESDTSPVLPTLVARRLVDRTRRIVAGEASHPRDTEAARAWADLDDARRALKAIVVSADGLALGQVSAPHPALGDINGYEWIAFAGAHEARHAAQIREDAAGLS